MSTILKFALTALFALGLSHAQEFDSASVKPAQPGTRGYSIQPLPGRLSARNANLKQLAAAAYHVHDYQIAGGPKWIAADTWDVEAKASDAESAPGEKELMAMLQRLLEKRFGMAAHKETKEQPLYMLRPAKSGVKVEAAKDPSSPEFFRVYQRHQITSRNAPLSHLIEALSWVLGRPVVDQTGLGGTYDYKLEWSPDEFQPSSDESKATAESPLPSLDTELQQQMGLHIVLEHGPVEMVYIDRAGKPTVN